MENGLQEHENVNKETFQKAAIVHGSNNGGLDLYSRDGKQGTLMILCTQNSFDFGDLIQKTTKHEK